MTKIKTRNTKDIDHMGLRVKALRISLMQKNMEKKANELLNASLQKNKKGWTKIVNRKKYNESKRVAEQTIKQFPGSKIGWKILWQYYWIAANRKPRTYGRQYRKCYLRWAELSDDYSKTEIRAMREEIKYADAVDYNRNGNPDIALRMLEEISDHIKYLEYEPSVDIDPTHVLLERLYSLQQLKKWKELARLSFQFEEKDRYCLPARYYYLEAEFMLQDKDWIYFAESSVNMGLRLYPDDIKLLLYKKQILNAKGKSKTSEKYRKRAWDNFWKVGTAVSEIRNNGGTGKWD